eukprot:TRINITY_DN123079_c0_g1_i1.p1 TRINITY_DN123079_c0_g1~~TRINITY_DN123079_c0_g1_i1.p1  ORF type:complete len:608 (-),score=112.65 TRINITY_DN123079_c0_g1_i1:125-1948(-)
MTSPLLFLLCASSSLQIVKAARVAHSAARVGAPACAADGTAVKTCEGLAVIGGYEAQALNAVAIGTWTSATPEDTSILLRDLEFQATFSCLQLCEKVVHEVPKRLGVQAPLAANQACLDSNCEKSEDVTPYATQVESEAEKEAEAGEIGAVDVYEDGRELESTGQPKVIQPILPLAGEDTTEVFRRLLKLVFNLYPNEEAEVEQPPSLLATKQSQGPYGVPQVILQPAIQQPLQPAQPVFYQQADLQPVMQLPGYNPVMNMQPQKPVFHRMGQVQFGGGQPAGVSFQPANPEEWKYTSSTDHIGKMIDDNHEYKKLAVRGLEMAKAWVAHAAQRLQHPAVAQSALKRWLGQNDPAYTQKIIQLHHSVLRVLDKSKIVIGADSICNNEVHPFAYVEQMVPCRSDGCGERFKDEYVIKLCDVAFRKFNSSVHGHSTMDEQISALIIHEAFHHASAPAILDKTPCCGIKNARRCAQTDPAAAQDNGYNYQHLVSEAATGFSLHRLKHNDAIDDKFAARPAQQLQVPQMKPPRPAYVHGAQVVVQNPTPHVVVQKPTPQLVMQNPAPQFQVQNPTPQFVQQPTGMVFQQPIRQQPAVVVAPPQYIIPGGGR